MAVCVRGWMDGWMAAGEGVSERLKSADVADPVAGADRDVSAKACPSLTGRRRAEVCRFVSV